MSTAQPTWKKVGTIGDVNFVEHDGGPVFVDETGVYCPELEYVQNMPEGDAYVYRVPLEHLKLSSAGKIIPRGYSASWPHPEENYTEWFDRELDGVAEFCGIPRAELVEALISDNPMARASAYEAMAQYHGWENFDSYPLHFTNREELEARYNPLTLDRVLSALYSFDADNSGAWNDAVILAIVTCEAFAEEVR
jgi:hypothetical protein